MVAAAALLVVRSLILLSIRSRHFGFGEADPIRSWQSVGVVVVGEGMIEGGMAMTIRFVAGRRRCRLHYCRTSSG